MEPLDKAVRKINRRNMVPELQLINQMLHHYSFVSFDTEFPRFLKETKRYGATEEQRYNDLKYTVDRQKLLQLGFTLFDDQGNVGGTWEVNFSDAGLFTTDHVLRKKGIVPETNWYEGVDSECFREKFGSILMNHVGRLKWITFHGLYDMAYMLRLLTGDEIPNSISEFAEAIAKVFNVVLDVKYVANYCPGLNFDVDKLGLNNLARMLAVDRLGEKHRAGSDSLLTAEVFVKMVRNYKLFRKFIELSGFLYGISTRMMRVNHNPRLLPQPVQQQIHYVRPPTVYVQLPMPMSPYYVHVRPAPCYAPNNGVVLVRPSVPLFIH